MDHHFLLISILTSYLLIVTSASTTVAGSASESTSINDIRLNYIHCLLHRDNCTNLKQNVIELEQSGNLLDSKITDDKSQKPEPTKGVGNKVDLAVYIEAQCSDTSRFVHRQLLPTWENLAITNRLSLKIVPFGKAQCLPTGDDFSCQCQHGPAECELNQLMNCVIEMVADPHSYVPVISCIQGKRDLLSAGSKCLAKLHIPPKKLLRCASGPEGRKLLAKAGIETSRLDPPMNFVPWITINGKRSGDAFYDLKKNLCDAMKPTLPPQCTKQ